MTTKNRISLITRQFETFFLLLLALIAREAACQNPAVISIQENPYAHFRTLTTNDGLTHNQIIDIIQDHHNFLWIGTLQGLNRFDGIKMKSYQHQSDKPGSLPGGAVTCLAEDNNGTLWIGTEQGLCYHDRQKEQFIKVPVNIQDIDASHIRSILPEGDSLLWIEVQSGYLIKLNKKNYACLQYWRHAAIWQPYYYYHSIYRDKKGILWVGGRGLSPNYLDTKLNKLVQIDAGEKPEKKRADDISCFFEDKSGNFWVSGIDGAYLFNSEKRTFSRFLNVSTFSIIQPDNNSIWLGTGNGVYQYILHTQKMIHYTADINNINAIPDNYVNKIYADRTGTIWIATNNGLSYFRKSNNAADFLYHIPGNEHTLSSNFVTAALTDKTGNVWIGYKDHGIDLYNPETNSLKHFRSSDAYTGALPCDNVSCFYEDIHGDLYIGLWDGKGFARKRKNKNHFELFTFNPMNRLQDWYYDFAEDKSGQFYVGFWGAKGLQLFDRKKNSFGRNLMYKLNAPGSSRLITRLYTDSKNQVWIGTTRSGLHIYYPEKDTSQRFFNQPELKTSFEGLTIYDILEDKSGRIWIAADSLFCYDPRFNTFNVWGNLKGLACNHVYKIIQDQSGMLWLGTESGILSFNPQWNYGMSFPALSHIKMNEDFRAGTLLHDGRILFGSKSGLCIFNPELMIESNLLPDIFLTELSVKGVTRISDLSDVHQIILQYDENYFSVEFSSSDLASSNEYSYRYRLIGLENDWNIVQKGNTQARYTNVPAGKYVLEIQLAIDNSNWKDIRMKSVDIAIQPPFWRKSWFIILSAVILLSIIILIIRSTYQRILIREKNTELKTLLLRAQINPHFIFNALVAIQAYIYKKDEKEAGRYLSEFARLMRLILENTKEEYITLEKEIQLLEYYLRLQQIRFAGKFTFHIDIDPKLDRALTKIPPMLAQPYIENAVEHGLSKKENAGHILLQMTLRGNYIVFLIEDNGIGRARSKEIRPENSTHQSYGTGITEERLEFLRKKHKLKIQYKIEDLYNNNNQASGTRVTFEIPVNYS
ncbi:MAG: histidine kinase [Lentimicrobiaceae bacterium]|nr:histidine kinase [Lentimicrobiaceae bacterium]